VRVYGFAAGLADCVEEIGFYGAEGGGWFDEEEDGGFVVFEAEGPVGVVYFGGHGENG